MPVERVWLDYDDDYELTGEVMSGSLHGGEIHVTSWCWDLSAVHQSPDHDDDDDIDDDYVDYCDGGEDEMN